MKNSTRLYTVCIHRAQPKIFLKNHYTNFLNVELEVENFRPRQFGFGDEEMPDSASSMDIEKVDTVLLWL